MEDDRIAAIEPLYFASSNGRLFGCYHRPTSPVKGECGVVLCPPMGEEYIRFHRAYRLLADDLARAGFPALRFDLFGCGDSVGSSEEGRIPLWCRDVWAAIDHVRRRSAREKVCLVGLRLGGSLAALVGAERRGIEGMVLWDPVVSGRDHLVELMASHGRMLQQAHVRPVPAPAQAGPVEILGFPLTSAMRQDLDALHLLAIEEPPANKTLVVESNPERGQGPLVEHLTSIGADLTHQHLPDSRLWIWDEAVGRILVARKIVGHVVSWIAEVCA